MPDFVAAIQAYSNLPEDAQRKAGQAVAAPMDAQYRAFLKTVTDLIDAGKIDFTNPKSLLNGAVYDGLSEEWKERTDVALLNILDLLRHIVGFYKSKQTPDESPQLETMIEHLWHMKQRIEEHYDVFIF